MDYESFIKSKIVSTNNSGIKEVSDTLLNKALFDYQAEIVKRACKKGKYALFVDTGLGKSIMQLNFGHIINSYTQKPVLILAPLVVVYQLLREAEKFGYNLNRLYDKNKEIINGLNITNYDYIDNIKTNEFNCVILDESSILKNFTGKTKSKLVNLFKHCEYKLACTATPSPNDFMELGNHSEFLDVMKSNEMLMRFFINDTMNFGTYRLKGHSEREFWEWVSSWAECISSPADLGYDDTLYKLPKLNERLIQVTHDSCEYLSNGLLFKFDESNATTLAKNKKKTIDLRIKELRKLLKEDEQHLIWVDTNSEADLIKSQIKGIVEVRGNDKDEIKAQRLMDFANGKIKWLMTKSSIAGMGMNFQNAYNMTFLGLNYSYEKYYQAVRRMWRFRQKQDVNVNVIVADNEQDILKILDRKKEQHLKMKDAMTTAVRNIRLNKKLTTKVNLDITIPKFLKG